ncbi:MAG TPA: anti-sigma factor [Solirubrobacteraceae bacterium]|nr:anti-sigma factor [Solirubrobacteraceae bacterium]
MSEHADWGDSAAAFVLGALPPEELEAFRAHLGGCAECRRAVEELQVAADALPMGVQQLAPPPALKARIMAVVESEAELLAAAGAGADRTPARRRRERRAWWARPGLALAAVLVALAGGALAGGLLAGDEARTVVAQVRPPGADVRLEIAGDEATLVVRDMPAPPAGRIYQVWLQKPGQDPAPTDALWSVNAQGDAEVAVPGSLEGVEAVLVTDEPEGGSPAPTRDAVISAAPA